MNQINNPDNKRLSDGDLYRMKKTPQTKIIRRVLKLSQEEFTAAYQIPIGTLRIGNNSDQYQIRLRDLI